MEPVDVGMITKNSEHCLEDCLKSVYKEIPVNSLIVVDGYSTDRTLDILKKFDEKHGNVKVLQDRGTRATARQKCIENMQREWFVFVDSDVILSKHWFERAWKKVSDEVGAVWGPNVDMIPNFDNKFFYNFYYRVGVESFKIRGGLHDTLIRREAVEGVKIPDKLHSYEDAFLLDWIKKKGYKIEIGEDFYCLHLRPRSDWEVKPMLKEAYEEIKYGLVYSRKFKYALLYPFHLLYGLIQFSKNKV